MDTELDEDVKKVAIVGKPNAGKSSILNRLIGEERVIVSPIAVELLEMQLTPI